MTIGCNIWMILHATDRSKISSALSLHPLSFFANTPFNKRHIVDSTVSGTLWRYNTRFKYDFHYSQTAKHRIKFGSFTMKYIQQWKLFSFEDRVKNLKCRNDFGLV